ncbi:hypothetical protein KY336_03815 [Candidatus Woesearchaeota archaeon]|nr:hypothetical protein [Candidatus Woesearchaeota archaeon]
MGLITLLWDAFELGREGKRLQEFNTCFKEMLSAEKYPRKIELCRADLYYNQAALVMHDDKCKELGILESIFYKIASMYRYYQG